MRIKGCDLHARQQTLAMLETTTGEMVNLTLMHEGNDVREFYSPNFDGALARFRAFLKQNNYPENVVWVMTEDILLTGKRFIYVRVPIPAENEERIRRMYDDGVTQGRGLIMGTVCRMNQSTYSYLWFPRSAGEIPQGIWPTNGDLKLSASDKSSSPAGRPIKDQMLWMLLKLWHHRKQSLVHGMSVASTH
jgi:hypothetical protein